MEAAKARAEIGSSLSTALIVSDGTKPISFGMSQNAATAMSVLFIKIAGTRQSELDVSDLCHLERPIAIFEKNLLRYGKSLVSKRIR